MKRYIATFRLRTTDAFFATTFGFKRPTLGCIKWAVLELIALPRRQD